MSEPSFDTLLSSVLGNEELLNKISGIASSHENSDEALSEVIKTIATTIDVPKLEDSDKKDSSLIRKDKSKNTKLLVALKPYLSDKRAQMIDNILRIEQIAELIKLTR